MASPLEQAVADLTAKVHAETTVVSSAVAYINGVPQLIADAVAAAQASGASPETLAALSSLGTELDKASSDMQAALTANTAQG